MRIVFAGTPQAAVPSLRALIESPHDVVAVVTRPDAPSGRGRKVSRSPVGELADASGIPLLQPRSAKDQEFASELTRISPDACAIVAYGALLPSSVLKIPTHGWINLHFSLLPQWRGAAPVQHAIWHGDDVTGATTFKLEEGMDTGPIYGTVAAPIRPTETSGSLLKELADSGSHLLVQTLSGIETGRLSAIPQSSDGVSIAPKLTVDDARVDWALPALAIDRRIRACTPNPGAWTELDGVRVKLGPVEKIDDIERVEPAVIEVGKREVIVGTGSAPVRLSSVKPAGKREMLAIDWLRGVQPPPGTRFA